MQRPMSIWVTGEPVPEARQIGGSFADMIRAQTGDAWPGAWQVVDCLGERAALPAVDETAGVIVTGSPARIAEQAQWMRRVQDGLRDFVHRGVPVLGICFGHQLLGMALGGRSGPNPRGREIGTALLRLREGAALLEAPRLFHVSMTHLDVVLDLPPGAELLGGTVLDPYAAVRFGPCAWGVQFHPEMNGEILRAYLVALRPAVEAEGLDAEALLQGCRDTPASAELLRAFARLAAGREAARCRDSACGRAW